MVKKVEKDWSGAYKQIEPNLKVPYPEICGMYGVEEVEAITKAMQGHIYTLGPYTKKFQEEFARFVGTKYAFAVTNCANALEMAAYLIGICPGDEVIVPAITFYSTTLGILRLGGKVVFADIDPVTYNLTAETIASKITRKTKAIYVVHLNGLPVDMDPIMKLARKHNIKVVEDCAHAPGALYKGRKVGSIGDYGCFSFHSAKNMTTLGEGGMLTTDNDADAADALPLRHVGMKPYGKRRRYWIPYIYDIVRVRGRIPYNFCMTELQAAAGRVQLKKLNKMNGMRRKIAATITEGLKDMKSLQTPFEPPGYKHVYHLYPIQFSGGTSGDVNDLIEMLRYEYGIRTCPLYPPVYTFTIYREMGYKKGLCPIAEKVYSRLFDIPFTPALTEDKVSYMIESIRKAVKQLGGA